MGPAALGVRAGMDRTVRPLAGVLLVPYLLWVSFAAVLNYVLWQLNPQILG